MRNQEMKAFNYDRASVKSGIVHFGVGNFHRAHLEYYNNLLLEDPAERDWGVFGAMIMPSDDKLYHALEKDSGIYDLTVCSPSGERTVFRIGSLTGICWGMEDHERIIRQIASEQTRIITLTITEGGYKSSESGQWSVFRYVAEGLRLRMADNRPITILSCDNLQHNGDTAREAFLSYFRENCPDVALWAEKNVSFPNCMVDRITPATKSGKITDVCCEDFIQWVVEDKFMAGRPSWEKVGVLFTDDVTPYENMKLSLLNASHTLLSYPSYLEGYRKVDEVLADERYRCLIRDFMDKDITPFVPAPEGVDIEQYKDSLLRRFSNAAISDQVSRLCGDGAAKFEVYIVPNLAKMIRGGKDLSRPAFLIASYCKYLMGARTESGEEIVIFEPHLSDRDRQIIASGDPMAFLGLSAFSSLALAECSAFAEQYKNFLNISVSEGLRKLSECFSEVNSGL